MTKKWKILHKVPISGKKIQSIVEVLLKNRGIKTKKQKDEFFNPPPPDKISVENLSLSRREIDKAIKRIKKAKDKKERVVIFGDYDADGICGTAILWECLYGRGFDATPYIPERFSEGYGLKVGSLEKIKTQNPNVKLVITVDNGIVANDAISKADKQGIDVIVTDHHSRGKVVPKAQSIVYSSKISGAAVAWVLAREIRKSIKYQVSSPKYGDGLELVAIGTIGDQMPLVGPNRSFAKYGLETLSRTRRLGLLALYKEAGLKNDSAGWRVGPYEIGFIIAPRLNATGRLGHAIESLRLLCTTSVDRARDLATHLGKTNQERQKVVDTVLLHAKAGIKNEVKFIILAHESYHEGVIGLAAGKLVEEFYRPAIVISKKKDIAKASARSIPGFNIIEVIKKSQDMLVEGGGHPMAAGFSIKSENITAFRQKMEEISGPLLTKSILSKQVKIDLRLRFSQLTGDLFRQLKLFEPTGIGNPSPSFVTKRASVIEARTVGVGGQHLRLRLKDDGSVFEAIGFGLGSLSQAISVQNNIDVVYTLEENTWNGEKSLQLKIKDIRL